MVLKKIFISSVFTVLVLSLNLSCGKNYSREDFLSKLEKTDSYLAQGRRDKALKQLSKLKNRIETSEQYISIAKRFMAAKAIPQAVMFLQDGISRLPDSPEIPALLIHILSEAGKFEEAAAYSGLLKNSPFAGLGAEAVILNGKNKNLPLSAEPELFEAAYNSTNLQSFLQASAIILCRNGKINQAQYLRSKIPDDQAPEDPFFWSCIAYDLGLFDTVFSDLYFTVAYAEQQGVFDNSEFSKKAGRHLLLAADAAYGSGDLQSARSFWQDCADFPNPPPIALYNLALTAEDEASKAASLISCIEKYPGYYPVIASYIRQYIALRSAEFSDKVTLYLEKRGFYSMKMEELYFTLPKMIYQPEYLLEKALKKENHDPRFALEFFRYTHLKDNDFIRGAGDMWKLLETYPESLEVKKYAKWYFSRCRDFNACFSIGKTGENELDAFYEGLEYSLKTEDPLKVLNLFKKAAENKEYTAAATANSAYIYYLQEQIDKAVNALSSAAELVEDKRIKSKMHYEIAVMLSEKKHYGRAASVLGYALELDPQNYTAAALLSKLKEIQ